MAGRILLIAALCAAAVGVLWCLQNTPAPPEQTAAEKEGAADLQAAPADAAMAELQDLTPGRLEQPPGAEAEATRPSCVLTVAVHDTAGAPVDDWIVVVAPATGEVTPRRDVRLRTDAGGRVSRKLEPGAYEVHAFGRTTSGPLELELQPGEEREVELVVNPPLALHGLVLDPVGQPAPLARILLRTESVWGGSPVEVARADAGGRFLLRTVKGALGMVSATAEGYRASEEQIVSTKRTEIELRLGADPARLSVSVLRADGTPASTAWVRIQSGGSAIRTGGLVPGVPGSLREGSCDAEGRVSFTDLWPGSAQLTLREPGHVPHAEAVDLVAGRETVRRIRLFAGATLAGTVRDESGSPVAGATIGGRARVTTRSARDGAYELAGLDPAITGVEVTHPDYETAGTMLALLPGGRSTWDPVLRAKPRIRGRLVDAAGMPLPDYMVLARDSLGQVAGLVACAIVTEADGRFELRPQRRSTFSLHVYDASRRGRIPFQSQPEGGEAVVPGENEILLRLTQAQLPNAGVRGRLVLPEGLAPERIVLSIHQQMQDGGSHYEPIQEFDPATRTFRHGPVPPGEYGIKLVTHRPWIVVDDLARFTLVPGEQRELGDLTPPGLGTLEVRARLSEGDLPEPPSVELTRLDDGRLVPVGRCDKDGRLVMLLPVGRYRARISGAGFCRTATEIAITAGRTQSCDIALEPGRARDLHFVLPSGEESCRYEVRRSDGLVVLELVTRKDRPTGGHAIPSLAAGRYEVLGIGSSGRRYTQSFAIDRLEQGAPGIRIDPKPIR